MTTGWTPAPQLVDKQATERSDKSETLALEILKIAAQANGSAIETANRAEVYWQWVTSDTWDTVTGKP